MIDLIMIGQKVKRVFLRTSLIVTLLMALFPAASGAGMAMLTDSQMSAIYSQGFSSFTLEGGVARAQFDITARTYTEIDSLKLGYYNDGSTTGWDQDWTTVKLGSDTEDLVVSGIYIEAVFDNIGDPATRALKSIKMGTPDMSGAITANFNGFSGDIAAGSPISGHRLAPTFTSISFTNTGCYVSLAVDGAQKGYWVHWDNATTQ
jgi:hypothetical protein